MKNPVVLFGHDSFDLPIAKTISVVADTKASALMFDIYFPTVEELATDPSMPSAHALRVDAIYNMAKGGILNAVSVGFRGLEWEQTPTGRAYTKQELMEISIVPIPANPNALAVMRAAGVDDVIMKGVLMPDMKTVEKAGRALSGKNKETLSRIRDTLEGCREDLRKFLDEVAPDEEPEGEPEPEAEPEEASEKSAVADEIYFELVEKYSTAEDKGAKV